MFAVLNKFHKKEWFSQYALKELNSRKFRDNTGDGWVGECGVAVSSQQATYKTLAGDLGHLRGQEKHPWLGRTWERERWRSGSGMGSVPLRGGWGMAGVPMLGVAYFTVKDQWAQGETMEGSGIGGEWPVFPPSTGTPDHLLRLSVLNLLPQKPLQAEMSLSPAPLGLFWSHTY